MPNPILQLLRIFSLLVLSISLITPAYCASPLGLQGERTEVARPYKAVIEAIDLKGGTLLLNGQKYAVAKDVRVITHDNRWLSFSDLDSGLVIEYLLSSTEPETAQIEQIRLLSEEPSP